MEILNCNFLPLNPMIVMEAIRRSPGAAKAVANPALIEAWEKDAIRVDTVCTTMLEAVPEGMRNLEKYTMTLGGIPLERNAEMPETVVEFCDKENQVLLRLENIAIPALA